MQEGSVSFTKKAGTEIEEGLMGYWTSLHLIDVKIKTESIPIVKKSLKTRKGRGSTSFQFFFERAMLDREGFLTFKGSENDIDPYVPDEEEGDVPALYGKWYEDERIAAWVKQHSEKGGRIVLHSQEGDGEAWGWEFDGRGRMRALELCPIGKWE
jgi:hypothetical protein